MVNIWNSLPNEVVEIDTVKAFKYRLDKHCSNQDEMFDFNADLTGTGSVPICGITESSTDLPAVQPATPLTTEH